MHVDLLIPALDEERALPGVIAALPAPGSPVPGADQAWVRNVLVVDNGSRDATAEVASRAGARVVREPRRGYGAACLAGLAALRDDPPDAVVFLDADGSDDPDDLGAVLGPIARGEADLVVGSRVRGGREPGSLTAVQEFGNTVASAGLGLLWGGTFTDLGPFRAIRWSALADLRMRDAGYGWTVEMQARALARGLRCSEVAVRYRRRRAGRSKVAGTLRGSIGAGWKILFTLARVRCGG